MQALQGHINVKKAKTNTENRWN